MEETPPPVQHELQATRQHERARRQTMKSTVGPMDIRSMQTTARCARAGMKVIRKQQQRPTTREGANGAVLQYDKQGQPVGKINTLSIIITV
jgi:hypothetical protein